MRGSQVQEVKTANPADLDLGCNANKIIFVDGSCTKAGACNLEVGLALTLQTGRDSSYQNLLCKWDWL